MSAPLEVRRPIAVWNRPIKAEWRGIFKTLTRAVGHGISQQWTELASDAAGLATALGVDTPVEERAWMLVRCALARAVFDLVGEYGARLPEDLVRDELAEDLDARFEAMELEITPRFLQRPAELSVVEDAGLLVAEWLREVGVHRGPDAVISRRLAAYFVDALVAEWRAHRATYEPIVEALDTPFTAASEREHAWRESAARLRRQINEPMFGESFGLEQVYVPRRAAHEVKDVKDVKDVEEARRADPFLDMDRGRARVRQVVQAEDHMRRWLAARDRRDAIRVLSGGPGSGKSSFARMLAGEQAKTLARVVFVPLFELDMKDSLPAALDGYMRRLGLPLAGLLDPDRGPDSGADHERDEDRLLLIFDGLDELSIRGHLGAETARQFVRQVERAVRDMNRDRCLLQVLITGRELAVQATESELRHPGQIVHLLPYYVPEAERGGFRDPDGLLPADQRDTWWARYAWAAGRDQASMPDELRRQDLEDITSEPLLCYLVALSYLGGRIDFASHEVNLSEIYDDLARSVYDRGYERRKHKGVSGLSHEEFVAILEEIGLAAWHGSGRTATMEQIRAYCTRDRRLAKLIDRFEKDAEAGVTSLLAAFYFRQGHATEVGDRTFEFTHKSFREYLTARRIVRAAARIATKLGQGDDGDEDGWDEDDALVAWVKICGPAVIDFALLRFVRSEVQRHEQHAARWQRVFARLMGRMLRTRMPMERLERRSFRDELRRACNAEVALLVMLDACSRVTEERSTIDWPSPHHLGAWIKSVQGQRMMGKLYPLELECLTHLDMQALMLIASNFRGAELQDVNLDQSNLVAADLLGAKLVRASLCGALLYDANLESAWLVDADLRFADAQSVRLAQSVLHRAKLQNAQLTEADLTDADLRHAQLQDANLENADLRNAVLTYADLHHAQLQGADLEDADLKHAILRDANLAEANLHGANLQGANLRGAKLDGADLRDVRYSDDTLWPIGFDPSSLQSP